jgi:phytoene desaturase
MQAARKRALIVGAGLGGLATAARLSNQGWQVEVFDRRSGPGGKAFTANRGGYRFDTGPSNLTLVPVFEELFRDCGADFHQRVPLTKLDTICHYWFEDGDTLAMPGSVEGAISALSSRGWASRRSLEKYFRHLKFLYETAGTLFLEKSLQSVATWLGPEGLRGILRMPFLDVFTTLDGMNRRYFDNAKMLQLFGRYATYNGSSPYKTPGTLGIIPWLEYSLGGSGVNEGIYALPTAIEQLGREKGALYHYNETVTQITRQGGRVTGIVTDKGSYEADVVVSNSDVLKTYQLLGDENSPWAKRYRKLQPSSSGLVYTWGVKKSFPELGLHNIFFSGDYQKEFAQLFDQGITAEDPTIYLNITSKLTPGDAPEGCENWFVLVNVPPNRGQDWASLAAQNREVVLNKIEKLLGKSVREHLVHEEVLDPPGIERLTGSSFGSIYGMSSNSTMAAFNRHPNQSTRHKGLWFVSGGGHPGAGMPVVLLSAKIASAQIGR